MTTAKRPLVILSAAAILFTALAFHPETAEARHRHGWRMRHVVGAVIAGAIIAEVVGATVDAHVDIHHPAASVHVHTHPAPPPPPPPPPPPYYYSPPPSGPTPVYVVSPPPRRDYAPVGLSLAGTVQSGSDGDLPAVGGIAATLQLRTSRHSLIGLELQSVGARRESDLTERHDLAALVAGRIFFWNAALAPYFELAGGLGRSSLEIEGWQVSASQLLGRAGLGMELRLGRHLALDAQLASLHRLRLGDRDDLYAAAGPLAHPFDDHERAAELRFGATLRF